MITTAVWWNDNTIGVLNEMSTEFLNSFLVYLLLLLISSSMFLAKPIDDNKFFADLVNKLDLNIVISGLTPLLKF